MPIIFSREFDVPHNLSLPEQVTYCKTITEKLRKEARLLRQTTASYKRRITKLEQEVLDWKEKYTKIKKENGQLKIDKEKLKQEVERLTKTNSRYQVSLFDSGNFKSPTHQEKKIKGGQSNHPDTNREGQINFPGYENFPGQRIYAKVCGKCKSLLPRVDSTKQKILLDIVVKPEVIKMIIESERQWCSSCKMEVNVKSPQSLPFTEYGLNSFMMVMILRFSAHCSFSTTSKVIEVGFGLYLSPSDISNILKMAAKYLGSKYEDLKQAVRDGDVIYMDETGWLVRGNPAWMWIMANEEVTVYVAAESRGKGIAMEMYGSSTAKCMTDGLGSYTNSIPKDKHCLCLAHMLRFAHEETIHSKKNSMAVYLRDELVRIYHIKFLNPEYSKEELKNLLNQEFDKLLALLSDEVSFKNIQGRIKDQKEGLILSLLETDSGTNNLAERELRPLVLGRNISFGSDTYTGMEVTARLASVIQTLGRNKDKPLLPELKSCFLTGIQEIYPQYIHTPYFDSS